VVVQCLTAMLPVIKPDIFDEHFSTLYESLKLLLKGSNGGEIYDFLEEQIVNEEEEEDDKEELEKIISTAQIVESSMSIASVEGMIALLDLNARRRKEDQFEGVSEDKELREVCQKKTEKTKSIIRPFYIFILSVSFSLSISLFFEMLQPIAKYSSLLLFVCFLPVDSELHFTNLQLFILSFFLVCFLMEQIPQTPTTKTKLVKEKISQSMEKKKEKRRWVDYLATIEKGNFDVALPIFLTKDQEMRLFLIGLTRFFS